MKKRLRYLYEKGDTSYIEILSKASNWSGMLNQANYVEKLYEYDKQMLNRYILIKEEVAQKKNDLEDKKSDLETQKYELEEEQASMQQMIDEKKSQANDFDAQIAKERSLSHRPKNCRNCCLRKTSCCSNRSCRNCLRCWSCCQKHWNRCSLQLFLLLRLPPLLFPPPLFLQPPRLSGALPRP